MNPRYPTTRQFRRHRNERKLGRPLLALGALAGVVLYWIFSGPSTSTHRKPEMASVAETRALEEEIAAHLKTTQPATPAVPVQESARKEAAPDASESRRAVQFDPPSLTDPTSRLDAPENPPVVDPIIKDPARLAALKNLSATPARKSSEESKTKESGKGAGNKSSDGAKSADAAKEANVTHDAKKESPPKEEDGMPSAPADLPPKSKPPDLDMTFYRELPKRKVVVPLDEPVDQAG
ncbi:MAG: hypothetical protein HQL86_07445, partial [Magnetococcales bacterium]|nr:hypothetical protein [Magnetococcales bacterium]